jgi:hypothetical protein
MWSAGSGSGAMIASDLNPGRKTHEARSRHRRAYSP